MKICLMFLLLSTTAFAQDNLIPMSVKERLRLSLWSEGLQSQKPIAQSQVKKLPEEIEKPLRKL
jgi:hypothetical protein